MQPYDSTITLDHISGKREIELAIFLNQKTIQESLGLKLYLYEGQHITDIKSCGADEKKLASYTKNFCKVNLSDEITTTLRDIQFQPGEVAVLSGTFTAAEDQKRSVKLSIHGRDT